MIIINIECSVNQQLAGQKKWNKYYTSISQEYHCQAQETRIMLMTQVCAGPSFKGYLIFEDLQIYIIIKEISTEINMYLILILGTLKTQNYCCHAAWQVRTNLFLLWPDM